MDAGFDAVGFEPVPERVAVVSLDDKKVIDVPARRLCLGHLDRQVGEPLTVGIGKPFAAVVPVVEMG